MRPSAELGEHHFEDIAAPERVYQLGVDVFPPLRSLYRTTLPAPPTTFVGRVTEVGAVKDLLVDPETRVVTLTGMGGTARHDSLSRPCAAMPEASSPREKPARS